MDEGESVVGEQRVAAAGECEVVATTVVAFHRGVVVVAVDLVRFDGGRCETEELAKDRTSSSIIRSRFARA